MLAIAVAFIAGVVFGIIAAGMLMLWCEVGSKTDQLIHNLEAENRSYRRERGIRTQSIPYSRSQWFSKN